MPCKRAIQKCPAKGLCKSALQKGCGRLLEKFGEKKEGSFHIQTCACMPIDKTNSACNVFVFASSFAAQQAHALAKGFS